MPLMLPIPLLAAELPTLPASPYTPMTPPTPPDALQHPLIAP